MRSGSTRLALPMPPFQPNATVPRPAPTLPCSTGPLSAEPIASSTSRSVMGRIRMSLRYPSLVSPTTGLAERTRSLPGRPSR